MDAHAPSHSQAADHDQAARLPPLFARPVSRRADDLCAEAALGQAWKVWAGFLVAPVAALGVEWLARGGADMIQWHLATVCFAAASLLWLILAVPAVLVLRSHCFRGMWARHPVHPRSYLRGMTSIWAALEFGVLLGVCGTWATGAWLPCLLPATVQLMLLAMLWPSRRAIAVA